MGTAVYVVLEREVPGASALIGAISGKHLARDLDRLDVLANERGLTPLLAFFSANPDDVADLTGQDPSELPPEKWFDAADVLRTVRGLLPLAGDAADDLRAIEKVLAAADAAGARCHVALDV